MGTMTIETGVFIDVLQTLSATAGGGKDAPELDGVFLYSQKGEYGEGPGEVDLLAGLSTTGVVSGHYYRPFESGTFDPTFWPFSAIGLVSSAFGQRAAQAEGDHVLQITQLPDNKVSIREYGSPEDGVEVNFQVGDPFSFPVKGLKRILAGEISQDPPRAKDDVVIKNGSTSVWSMDTLGSMLKLSKSWKTRLVLHKQVVGRIHRVQMEGLDNWIGAVVPPTPDEAATVNDGITVETFLNVPELQGFDSE